MVFRGGYLIVHKDQDHVVLQRFNDGIRAVLPVQADSLKLGLWNAVSRAEWNDAVGLRFEELSAYLADRHINLPELRELSQKQVY